MNLRVLLLIASFCAAPLIHAEDAAIKPKAEAKVETKPDTHVYESGYKVTMKLGSELYKALDLKQRSFMTSIPVSLETDVVPFVRPMEYPDETKPLRIVFISLGFVDLMNNVAHSKAVDKLEKGYFEKYVMSLSKEDGEMSLKDLPGISDDRFWSEDMMNEQLSSFNQMVGMVLAIDLSHHYLGHYKKYQDKLTDAKGHYVPINNMLTEAEWMESMRAGARNALECGLGVDGLKSLYDCINKMPTRPTWTAYFLPDKVKVPKMLKELETIEKKYFQGQ
jgi:hypothetical protein